jgi:hypothetical protein
MALAAALAAIAAAGLWRRPLVDVAEGVASGSAVPAAQAPPSAVPSPAEPDADSLPSGTRTPDAAWRTPSSPRPRYA